MDVLTPREDSSEAVRSAGAELSSRTNWFQQHSRVVDLVVVLAVFAYNLPIQLGSVPDHLWPGTGLLLSAGLCAPYLMRRRYPLAAFAAIQLVAFLQVLLVVELLVADVMLLLAVYTLAVRTRWFVSACAALVLICWLLVAVVPTMARNNLSIGDVGVLGRRHRLGVDLGPAGADAPVLHRQPARAGRAARTREGRRGSDRGVDGAHTDRAGDPRHRLAQPERRRGDVRRRSPHGGHCARASEDGHGRRPRHRAHRAGGHASDARRAARRRAGLARAPAGDLAAGGPRGGLPGRGLPVSFTVNGEPGSTRISESVDLAVFRIVQESLTNVRRHAGPDVTKVDVRIRHRADAIEVRVTDDGRGPAERSDSSASARTASPGHGLVGMRERIAAHRGTLHTGARPGGGFEVFATVPKGAQA